MVASAPKLCGKVDARSAFVNSSANRVSYVASAIFWAGGRCERVYAASRKMHFVRSVSRGDILLSMPNLRAIRVHMEVRKAAKGIC